MPFIVKEEKREFVPAPAGPQQAVCCDVVDIGEVPTDYGLKPKVDIKWLTADLNEEGKPFVVSNRYTVSFNEKASLRKHLESWLGRALTVNELKDGFDLDWLIGKNCYMNLVHNETEKGTFANVQTLMPLPKGMFPIEVSSDYVRVQDRPARDAK